MPAPAKWAANLRLITNALRSTPAPIRSHIIIIIVIIIKLPNRYLQAPPPPPASELPDSQVHIQLDSVVCVCAPLEIGERKKFLATILPISVHEEAHFPFPLASGAAGFYSILFHFISS